VFYPLSYEGGARSGASTSLTPLSPRGSLKAPNSTPRRPAKAMLRGLPPSSAREGTMTAPLPPPGWYPDPSGGPGQRYFDGKDWTEQYAESPTPKPGPPRWAQWSLIGGAGLLLLLVVVVIAAIIAHPTSTTTRSTTSTTPSHTYAAPSTTPPPAYTSTYTPPPPPPPTPTVDDFSVKVIITGQECFGSAGCIYDYQIDPNYVGSGPRTIPTGGLTVVYEILGGDESKIDNFTLDTTYYMHYQKNGHIGGPDGANITAIVTRVVGQGVDSTFSPPSTTASAVTPSPTRAPPTATSGVSTSTPTLSATLPGTDSQGFLAYPAARCDPGNPAAALGRTTKSVLVVCQVGPGSYYYRGVRLSDGASIELANVVHSSGGWDVTNPVDGTRYEIRPDHLTITRGQTSESEPMVQYASS
jgi:Protein of unknown function (DUF2510)